MNLRGFFFSILWVALMSSGAFADEDRNWAHRIGPSSQLKYGYDKFENLDRSTESGKFTAFFYNGSNHYINHDLQSALTAFDQALEIYPKADRAHFRRGVVFARLDRTDEAIQAFQMANEFTEVFEPQYFYWLGATLAIAGNLQDAHKQLTFAINGRSMSPQTGVDALAVRADVNRDLKKFDDAINDYNAVITARSNNPDTYTKRGTTFYMMKDYPNAKADFEKSLSMMSLTYENYFYLGMIASAAGEHWEAVQNFNRAVIQIPNPPPAPFYYRGQAHRQLKAYDKAVMDYSKVIELDPSQAAPFNERCYIKTAFLGQAADALPDCLRAAELEPGNPNIADSLALTYEKLGQNADAIAEYKRALAINPDMPSSQEGLRRLGG